MNVEQFLQAGVSLTFSAWGKLVFPGRQKILNLTLFVSNTVLWMVIPGKQNDPHNRLIFLVPGPLWNSSLQYIFTDLLLLISPLFSAPL